MTGPLRLGMAAWEASEGPALVAPLPADETRLVDLHHVEAARLARLGEGRPERLAAALVPPDLGRILESGPRALQRLRQTLAYAEKWARRGDLPAALAPPAREVRLLPCLPRPSALRRMDGTTLADRIVRGPGSRFGSQPQPTLALAGLHRGGSVFGWCLALEDHDGIVLGAWMTFEGPLAIELRCGSHHRRIPADAWAGLALPAPGPGEAVLLGAPKLRPLPGLAPGTAFSVASPFELLPLTLGTEIPHATVQ